MKYTLLELVQNILSSMDSDEVNSITDTVEAQQVVAIIKTVYNDILTRGELNVYKTLFNLDASTISTKPVLMTKPAGIDNIIWLKYNRVLVGDTDPVWTDMQFLPVDQFLLMTHSLLPSATEVETMQHTADGFTFTFNFRNDIGPTYYTTFDDNTTVFDAYDNTVDTTLQTSKTLGFGAKVSTFTESDIFIPALQPQQFALLLNEAKALAWAELKQTQHQKAENTARRNWIHLGKTRRHIPTENRNSGVHPLDQLANFGRK